MPNDTKKGLKRDNAFFVRLSDKELEIVETAIYLMYGQVRGMKSLFARQCLLTAARNIIEAERKKEGE